MQRTDVSQRSAAIIKALLYFDIFKYPLKEEEISFYLHTKTIDRLGDELKFLSDKGLINHHEGFYFMGNDKSKIEKRIKGNIEAAKYLQIALKHSKWLSAIPFIQCICISGSLSKYYMDEQSDIDYFIITKTDRLWIVRGIFTIIIKSMWMFNSKKYFCPNYIIAENDLEIKDKNIYTAIEIATLIPMFNHTTYRDFLLANQWIKEYLPNFHIDGIQILPDKNRRFYKLWQHTFFTSTDNYIFKLFKYHYEKKFYNSGKWNLNKYDFNFGKTLVKIHTMGHRNKILDKYEESIDTYEKAHQIDLN